VVRWGRAAEGSEEIPDFEEGARAVEVDEGEREGA
jgi:hypothetical protein